MTCAPNNAPNQHQNVQRRALSLIAGSHPMGYIRNHAIVVTATYGDYIQQAHAKAVEIFGKNVTEISPEVVNGSRSFLVPPDGSKEGWDESDEGDKRRELFKEWLRAQAYEDHSTPLHWVELRYGGDDREAVVEDDCHAALRNANNSDVPTLGRAEAKPKGETRS